jgi:uncharacterized membrane protein
MKTPVLFLSLIIASGLLFTNIYNSIVDAANWGSNIPESIEAARQYFRASNPGNFFRIFSPVSQLLALICVVIFWKRGGSVRYLLIGALLFCVSAESMTFMYFYPRNDIMFTSGTTDVATLRTAWQEWNVMNWIRSILVGAGVVCSSLALHRLYQGAAAISRETPFESARHHTYATSKA